MEFRENGIARDVVDAAYRVHVGLGPGLLESVYEVVLADELERRGHRVRRQLPIPCCFAGRRFEIGFRADLVVDDLVLVEVKSLERLASVHLKQTLTYVRLAGKRLGLLVNFGAARIKGSIVRVANNLPEERDRGLGRGSRS